MKQRFGSTLLLPGLFAVLLAACAETTTSTSTGGQGPTPPTSLSARFITATMIRLEWRDNSINEEGFEIWESIGVDTNYVRIATAPANTNSLELTGKSSRFKYYFRVRSYSGSGISAFSNQVELEGGSMLAKLKPDPFASMRCAVFSPDGITIATGSGDHIVRLWNWEDESVTVRLLTHERAVLSLSYSPNGNRLASSDDVQTVIWNVTTAQYFHSFVGTKAKFSPDDRFLIANVDSVATIFDTRTYRVAHVLESAGSEYCFSQDGRWLVTGGDTLRKYDLTDTAYVIKPSLKLKIYESVRHAFVSLDGAVTGVSPTGDTALVGSHYIRLTDAKEVTDIGRLYGNNFAVSPDGSKLVAGSIDGTIWMWNLYTGEFLRELTGHSYTVYWVSWSWNGSFVISASADGSARLWGPFE